MAKTKPPESPSVAVCEAFTARELADLSAAVAARLDEIRREKARDRKRKQRAREAGTTASPKKAKQ
jgi:hypothetical protein